MQKKFQRNENKSVKEKLYNREYIRNILFIRKYRKYSQYKIRFRT